MCCIRSSKSRVWKTGDEEVAIRFVRLGLSDVYLGFDGGGRGCCGSSGALGLRFSGLWLKLKLGLVLEFEVGKVKVGDVFD